MLCNNDGPLFAVPRHLQAGENMLHGNGEVKQDSQAIESSFSPWNQCHLPSSCVRLSLISVLVRSAGIRIRLALSSY